MRNFVEYLSEGKNLPPTPLPVFLLLSTTGLKDKEGQKLPRTLEMLATYDVLY